jgi:pyruvate formate lyase activating enzyme
MGAEPVCDPLLPQIVTALKQSKDSFIILLTNGKKLPPLPLPDQVIFSIKAVTPSLHKDYTGYDNEVILKNFIEIASCKAVSLHTETVFIPGYVDEDEVLRIAEFIASVDRSIPLRIDAYLPIKGLPWQAPNVEDIHSLTEKVRGILPSTSCLYGDEGKTDLAYTVERIF